MNNKENIKEILDYLQAMEGRELQYDEDAILAAYQLNHNNQPLAIKILSIFGGILASLAFLGFLFIAGLYDSDFGLLTLGVLCISGAIVANKKYDKVILDTMSVSAFIIGLVLIAIGLGKLDISENIISIVFIAVALCTLAIIQNYILSFISVLLINGSILALILMNSGYDLIHIYVSLLTLLVTYVFTKEAKIIAINKALSKLYRPIRIGVVFSLLAGLVMLGKKGMLPIMPSYIWISSAIIISAIIYLLPDLFKILNITRTQHKTGMYTISLLLLLPTVLSPPISGAILIIMLCFRVNYKTGFVIGILAFIYFICQYYYDLHFTLLTKSILLLISGILFTGLYLLTYKKLASDEKI